MSFGFGGAVRYAHDPSGNIVEVAVEHLLGGVRRQAVEIGDMNRVESIDYIGAGRFEIGYDAMGRAVSFRMGGDEVLVEYEGPNRIGRIVSTATEAQWSPGEGPAGSATSAVADPRLELLQRDSAGAAHADYGIVTFDETTFGLAAGDPMQRGVPGLSEARLLLAVAEPLFSGDGAGAMMAFEKPSNPVFQPLEYRSTNCCINMPILPAALVPGGGPKKPGEGPSFCIPYLPGKSPEIEITTTPVTWYINNNVVMPNIQFAAKVKNADSSSLKFNWHLELEFSHGSRSFSNRVPRVGTAETNSPRCSPDWGNLLAGGNSMTVHVSTTIGGKEYSTSKSGFEIHGENPTQEQIFGIATRLEDKAVCWQESTHRQFEAVRYTGIEIPLWGSPDGWGLMQLELGNPAKAWGEDELWNWQDNLAEGVQYLGQVYDDANDYLNEHYRIASESIETTDDWPSNPADDENNVWDDAFARYNTGRSIYSRNGNRGMRNCRANSAGCNYAAAVRAHMNNKPWK